MASHILVNIGSGNGLLPDGTKPTWTNIDLSSVRASGIHLRAISQEIPQPPITKISLKIIYVKFHSNLPGANELISFSTRRIYTHNSPRFQELEWFSWKLLANNSDFFSKSEMEHQSLIWSKTLDSHNQFNSLYVEYGRVVVVHPPLGTTVPRMTLEIQVSLNVVMPHPDGALLRHDDCLLWRHLRCVPEVGNVACETT